MALLSRPSAKSIGRSVALVVVSSVSALLNAAFPRSHDGKMGPKTGIGSLFNSPISPAKTAAYTGFPQA